MSLYFGQSKYLFEEMSQHIYDLYEPVMGLEIHVQLKTKTKAFSEEAYHFGAEPNSQTRPISLAHPGTLPILNKTALEFAIRMGLACQSEIREYNLFARKNYFYADLPKGYQITQHQTPICNGGWVEIKDKENHPKTIRLTRIHLEEDTGKSIHDIDPFNTLIDLNRAGVPLIEIVSEPDFRASEEAYNYLSEIRRLVRYLGISNGNMEEGSLRCDANISVRKKGTPQLNTRVEVKNMNSMTHVKKAIEFEFKRQVELLESGGEVTQETRTWNAAEGNTLTMRTKEDAHDYRYFTEPDIPPVIVTKEQISAIQEKLPKLPKELIQLFTSEHNLSLYDAENLVDNKDISDYFQQLVFLGAIPKTAANWVMGDLKSFLNEKAISISEFPISAQTLVDLMKLIEDGSVSHSVASQKLFPILLENPTENPRELAEKMDLIQDSNSDNIQPLIEQVLAKYPAKVEEYRNGKKGVLGLFMGEVMKLSKGKTDPKVANQMLRQLLDDNKN